MTFAVFASGNGSNLQAIINAVRSKRIHAVLGLVVSDKARAYALTRAKKAKIPVRFINPKAFKAREDFDREVIKILRNHQIDFVVLAGFMRLLSPYFVKTYKHRILNIHPALLPSFKGAHAIKEAFDYGVKTTGVTVHLVDEKVDHGPIVLQEAVQVRPTDTLVSLEKKIHRIEHQIYPKAIDLLARGKLAVTGRKIQIK